MAEPIKLELGRVFPDFDPKKELRARLQVTQDPLEQSAAPSLDARLQQIEERLAKIERAIDAATITFACNGDGSGTVTLNWGV